MRKGKFGHRDVGSQRRGKGLWECERQVTSVLGSEGSTPRLPRNSGEM